MQPSLQRIHPLVAAAAVSVILVSMLGVATITGVLPQSNSQTKSATGIPAPAVKPAAAALVINAEAAQPGAAARTLTVSETLAPGETLIPSPSVMPSARPAMAVSAPVAAMPSNATQADHSDGPLARTLHVPHANVARVDDRSETHASGAIASSEHASRAPVLGQKQKQQRALRAPQVIAAVDAAPAESRQGQKIVPVYRDQRLPSSPATQAKSSGYAAESAAPEHTAPAYPQMAGSTRDSLPVQPYRRASRGEGDRRGLQDPVRSNDAGPDGPASRFGTTLGRTLGDGIDQTISAIADVLTGGRTAAQSGQRNALYGAIPGER